MMTNSTTYKKTNIPWLPEVPEHWTLRRLKSLIKYSVNGFWGDEPKGDKDDIICIRVADIDEWNYGIRDLNYTVRNVGSKEIGNLKLGKNDLIIEKSGGGDISPVGRVVIFNKDFDAITSNFMARLEIELNKVDNEFLYFYFRFLYNNRVNIPSIKATTGIQNIDLYSYLQNPIALPPLDEQRSIVQYINTQSEKINRFIAAKLRFIELLKEQRQGIIENAITRGIDPSAKFKNSGVDWLGKLPVNWKVTRCKNVFKEIDIRSQDGKEELLSVSHYDGVKKRSEKDVMMFMAEDYTGYKLCWPDDLVINIMWAWMGAMGISKEHGIVSSAYGVYRLKNTENYDVQFLDYLFRLPLMIVEYSKRSKGVHSSRARMYSDEFFQIEIITPPIEEQQQIVAFIQAETATIETAIAKAEREIELIREYRESMIAEAVTGKRKIPDHFVEKLERV